MPFRKHIHMTDAACIFLSKLGFTVTKSVHCVSGKPQA